MHRSCIPSTDPKTKILSKSVAVTVRPDLGQCDPVAYILGDLRNIFLNYDCRFFYHSAVIFLKRRMCFGTGFTEADDKSLPKATTIAVHAFVLQ